MKLPRLKEIREQHGWSQKQLSDVSGVSRDSISNYETDQRDAWPSTAKKLADALEVEIADLVEVRPKARAPLSLEDLATVLKDQVGSNWLALPEEEWSMWWRGVSKQDASERYQQILAEYDFIKRTWLSSREGREALARRRLYSLIFRRAFVVAYFAPQEEETEEAFEERSAKGKAIDAYYQSVFERQRQDTLHNAEEEERQLVGAANS